MCILHFHLAYPRCSNGKVDFSSMITGIIDKHSKIIMPQVYHVRQLVAIFVLCAVVLLAASILSAWTGPTQSPPEGNVAAPINVGSVDQVKDAALGVDGLAVFGSQYIQGNLGIGVESPTTALDVAGAIRMRGGGTPGAGKVLVATDGNGTLAWGTLSYSTDVTKSYASRGEVVEGIKNDALAGGLDVTAYPGAVYSDAAARARVCWIVNPAATVTAYTNSSFASPSNNYVFKWNGTKWVVSGASGSNTRIETITCYATGAGLQLTTDLGQVFTL